MRLNLDFVKPMIVFMQYFSAFIFLIVTTLLVSFNHKMFTRIAGEKTQSLWWLFVLYMTPLLAVVVFIFGIIFGKVDFVRLFDILLRKS
jgi:hypothetical protein